MAIIQAKVLQALQGSLGAAPTLSFAKPFMRTGLCATINAINNRAKAAERQFGEDSVDFVSKVQAKIQGG